MLMTLAVYYQIKLLNFFAAEFTKNSGQTTLEGGEGGIGDKTTARKRCRTGHSALEALRL